MAVLFHLQRFGACVKEKPRAISLDASGKDSEALTFSPRGAAEPWGWADGEDGAREDRAPLVSKMAGSPGRPSQRLVSRNSSTLTPCLVDRHFQGREYVLRPSSRYFLPFPGLDPWIGLHCLFPPFPAVRRALMPSTCLRPELPTRRPCQGLTASLQLADISQGFWELKNWEQEMSETRSRYLSWTNFLWRSDCKGTPESRRTSGMAKEKETYLLMHETNRLGPVLWEEDS